MKTVTCLMYTGIAELMPTVDDSQLSKSITVAEACIQSACIHVLVLWQDSHYPNVSSIIYALWQITNSGNVWMD